MLRFWLENVLYIVNCFHHIYLAHEIFGMPVNASHMAPLPSKHEVTKVKLTQCYILNKRYYHISSVYFNFVFEEDFKECHQNYILALRLKY